MMRNSIDHGVETKEERQNTSKDPCANVVVEATQNASDIVIKISDDGKGMDAERLFSKSR